MTLEERANQLEESTSLASIESQEVEPVGIKEPEAPQGITEDETQDLKSQAVDLVQQLESVSGSEEMELIDSVTNLGIQAQRSAGAELDLLRVRVGDMLTDDGPRAEISTDLVELRVALNQINPHELSRPSSIRSVLSVFPFVDRLTPPIKVLEKIAIRYEPVSRQVAVIETKLREGRMMLSRDNIELRKLYEQIEAQQLPIQKNAYLGELVMQQLGELLERITDPLKSERVRNALHDVSMRVQDMRTMETVHTQFFVSIEMTRQNNNRLGQAVERTLSLATNVITLGLAIQTALARQKRVLEATQRTQEFLGDVIAANAATIKKHTEEIGDLYNNPVVAMDKITQAHTDLIEAMDLADRLKQEGIDNARENIAKLSQMSAELQQRANGLRDQRALEAQSIEA
jgi:uncharacterized protein YaaN involved in tellurite resistance